MLAKKLYIVLNCPAKLVSRPIEFGSVTINSLKPYYSSKRLNLRAKNRLYGILANIDIQNKFTFFIDAGYKHYFDVIEMNYSEIGYYYENYYAKPSFYEDTFYVRFGFPLRYDWNPKNTWQGISFYMEKRYPFPRIAWISQYNSTRFLLEIGFYKNLGLSLAYRANYGER